jgi:hypothetical protein
MTDTHHDGDPAETTTGSSRPPQIEDTPLTNPLDQPTREFLARWLSELADTFQAELADGPTDEELREHELNAEEWVKHTRDAISRVQNLALHIGDDPLPFSIAGEARNLLQSAENHRALAAGAALEATITAAIPERMKAYERMVTEQKSDHGFFIQAVGGREETLALPSFVHTEGLADSAGHPELVMVAMPPQAAGGLLNDLGAQILARNRTVRAGEDLEDVLTGGYKLRVIACPDALAEQVRHRGSQTEVLQLLFPDRAGRFPGDPDVDPKFGDAQQYPKHHG